MTSGALQLRSSLGLSLETAALHVLVRGMPMTSQPSVPGLPNASLFSYLPERQYLSGKAMRTGSVCSGTLTVVSLGDPILDTTSLREIRDFRPVFIRVCTRTKGTAGTV